MELWGGSIPAGTSMQFQVGASVGAEETSAANWGVNVSFGGEYVACGGGPFGTAVVGTTDSAPPQLSEPIISDVNDSKATISWTTNEPAKSYLRYGKGYQVYEQSLQQTTLTTSHVYTITSLTANTTYYFEYRNEDEAGNGSSWIDFYSFTTGGTAAVIQPQIIRIETPAARVEQPKPEIVTVLVRDREPPRVRLTSTLEPFYDAYPEIELLATDNTVVAAVEYSVDGGKSWRPVTLAGQRASERLSVQLPLVVEGDYRVYVRAFDAERNRGTAGPFTVVIDRLPPVFGAMEWRWGGGLVMPFGSERQVFAGMPMKLRLGSLGGASVMKLTDGTELAMTGTGEVWETELVFDTAGEYPIEVEAVDGMEREATAALTTVRVLEAGRLTNTQGEPLAGEVWLYRRHPVTGRFEVWDGRAYGFENPMQIGSDGRFGVVLPKGDYYASFRAAGFVSRKSQIVSLSRTSAVTAAVTLAPEQTWLTVGEWQIKKPVFSHDLVGWTQLTSSETADGGGFDDMVGGLVPEAALMYEGAVEGNTRDWLGKSTVVVMDAAWSVGSHQSLRWLTGLAEQEPMWQMVWAASLESGLKLQEVRSKVGAVPVTLAADYLAELTQAVGGHALPVVMVLSADGQVQLMQLGLPDYQALPM